MGEVDKLLVGFFAGIIATWLGKIIETNFKREQYRHEKLMERYAEFAGILAKESQRSRELRALHATSSDHGSEAEMASLAEKLQKLETERIECKRDLARLAFQIRMLEHDESLAKRVADLAEQQPFIYPGPPAWGRGSFNERFDEFYKAVEEFRKVCDQLLTDIAKLHSGWRMPEER